MAGSLEGTKFMAAILTAGIIASGAGNFARIIYQPHELEEPVYKIALPEGEGAGGAEPAAEPEKPIAALLASADAGAGEAVAKKCGACHSFDKGGANKVGPNLWGVVNRPVGKHEGFAYSNPMASHGGNWDYEALNHFLTSPKGYMPGTKMSFAGLPKDVDRANVILYLHSLADSPEPLPPPG
jgi:cytochrome c